MTDKLSVIGSGCASLSLAKEVALHKLATPCLYTDKSFQDRPNHIWGFWEMPWLSDAKDKAHHKWTNWQIITDQMTVHHRSDKHPYHALQAQTWLSYCHQASGAEEVIGQLSSLPDTPYFDSRPLAPHQGIFYQHFVGQHIQLETDSFDSQTAILMDFRCDQSQGLHFIYLLPFSAREALVESTFFSEAPHDDAVYIGHIQTYLATHHAITSYEVTATESGVIPMADLRDRKAPSSAIGARGGALRPSSGYAFSFIQKQVAMLIEHYKNTGNWQAQSPLSARDLWMDKVFLAVLHQRPELSVEIFLKLAKALTGDEFAQFMSGIASYRTLVKMMMAMPKVPFIKAALSRKTYQRGL